jgi:hypothetical protein
MELIIYFKLNHKIMEQFKHVKLKWGLIWILNGIIYILVIKFKIILLVKL